MIFQTLDDKSECVGIYTQDKLVFDPDQFPDDISQTWKYAPYLRDKDVDYISLYLEGDKISDYIPEYLKDDWEDVSKRIQSFKRSLRLSKVNTHENCFFDLVPQRFLMDFCEVKNKICEHIIKTVKKPERYEFYKHVSMMLGDIAIKKISIDRKIVNSFRSSQKLKNQAKAILENKPYADYNQFGTRTGRLTTKKGSFPILTLNKEFRSAVIPQNDFFVELDFNGAEVRTLLGLLGKEQPSEDVHDFHLREIFTDINDRPKAKVAFFAWLYGARSAVLSQDVAKLAKFYEKDTLLEKYWDGNTVTTPYKKQIPDTSEHHALNYLVQSTAAELTLKQALKVEYLLRTRSQGSNIAFLIHDAIVLDMKKEDADLIKILSDLMSSTNFGTFRVNIKRGKTLGSMKDIKLG
ncbi:MAG: hypothetical protein NZ811_09095 [Gammaproteobacteria bacterium]|nr:hypothetical protein [Gammaproteobacteria bacterium]